jgi:hypothetical protein
MASHPGLFQGQNQGRRGRDDECAAFKVELPLDLPVTLEEGNWTKCEGKKKNRTTEYRKCSS